MVFVYRYTIFLLMLKGSTELIRQVKKDDLDEVLT
jgi:hypothetical protein